MKQSLNNFQRAVHNAHFLSPEYLESREAITFLATLAKSCTQTAFARQVETQILQTTHRNNRYLNHLLVSVFINCGSVPDAHRVLDRIENPNIYSHNLLISAYAQNGHLHKAKSLFDRMPSRDRTTWNCMIQGLAKNAHLNEAKLLFERTPNPSKVTWTLLIHAFASSGHLHEARAWFQKMPEKDTVVYTVMVDAHAQHGHIDDAIQLFHKMPERNLVSWNALVLAFAQHSEKEFLNAFNLMPCWTTVSLNASIQSSAHARSTFDGMLDRDMLSWTILVSSYAQRGYIRQACLVFELMPAHDEASWTSMLVALVENEDYENAERFFFHTSGYRNVVSWTSLLQAFHQTGDSVRARGAFEKMPQRSVITFNVMLNDGDVHQARQMFDEMVERNLISWTILIRAYAGSGHLQQATKVFYKLPCWTTAVWNVLLGYCDASLIKNLFDKMPERDLVSWTMTIQAYAQYGHLEIAEFLFERMPERDVKSWSVFLHAAAQAHDVERVTRYFHSMPQRNVSSWNALLAAYALKGHFGEFKNVFNKMSKWDTASWNTLIQNYGDYEEALNEVPLESFILQTTVLSAYAQGGHVSQVRRLFMDLNTKDAASYNVVIQCNAQNGQFEDAMELFRTLGVEGVKANEKTFTGVLSACAHVGSLSKCCECFHIMISDYGIHTPSLEHYCCVVDVLGKCKKLDDAEELIGSMPFVPDLAAWTSLLNACRMHGDMERGQRVSRCIEFQKPAPYVLLSNTYVQQMC